MSEDKQVKKTSLAEAAKRMLEQKKQAQAQGGGKKHQNKQVPVMKSQVNQRTSNTVRRIGGS